MIDVGIQISVGFERAAADRALAFARNGLAVDLASEGGRLTIDPKTQIARVETLHRDGFSAVAELPSDALIASLDTYTALTAAGATHAVIGLQFPIALTLAQGLALRHAIEHAEEVVIEHAAGRMTIGRDAIDIVTDVIMPMIDPATMRPVEGGEHWKVHGVFRLGGDEARGSFLQLVNRSLDRERAKN